MDESCAWHALASDFPTALDSGDESPGTARYATWWSPCDAVINPDDGVLVSGAKNTKTACLSHTALLTDATVYAQTRDMVDAA